MEQQFKYKRILLKLSGEVLAGNKKTGIDFDTVEPICEAIRDVNNLGVQVGIVEAISGEAARQAIWTEREQTTSECSQQL